MRCLTSNIILDIGANPDHDPDQGIFPLRHIGPVYLISCKIFASNSINNDYCAWGMSFLGGGLRSLSSRLFCFYCVHVVSLPLRTTVDLL